MRIVRQKFVWIVAVGLLALGVTAVSAQGSAPADATQALLGAFNNYDIVAVDDAMNIQQAADFYTSLVTNATFAANVGNVVIDFGNSADQSIIDNYVAGQNVSDSDLAQVWVSGLAGFAGVPNQNTASAIPLSYTSFVQAIRQANQALPDSQKIHVWLGAAAPSQATPQANSGGNGGGFGRGFGGANNGQFLATLIETQILSQNKKALVIARVALFNPNGTTGGFGGRGGFRRGSGGAAATPPAQSGGSGFTPPQNVRQILEKDYPGKTIVAALHRGMTENTCNSNLETIMASWTPPVVAVVQGTSLQSALSDSSCHELGSFGQAPIDEGWVDGYLYLGPVASLTMSPTTADQQSMSYLDYIQQMQQQIQQLQQQFQRTPEATQSS